MYVCMYSYSRTCAFSGRAHYFHLVCQALTSSPEAARDLQVNKPETRGAPQRTTYARVLTHMQSWGLILSRRAPALSPPYIAWHSHPLRSPHLPHTLNQSNTHSHNGTSPISLNPAYQTFRFFSFPYPCTDITLHSQSPHFVSSSQCSSILFMIHGVYILKTAAKPEGISVYRPPKYDLDRLTDRT